jgi:hypothetical protein
MAPKVTPEELEEWLEDKDDIPEEMPDETDQQF